MDAEDEELLARARGKGKHGGGSKDGNDNVDDDINDGDRGGSTMDVGDEALLARKFCARP